LVLPYVKIRLFIRGILPPICGILGYYAAKGTFSEAEEVFSGSEKTSCEAEKTFFAAEYHLMRQKKLFTALKKFSTKLNIILCRRISKYAAKKPFSRS